MKDTPVTAEQLIQRASEFGRDALFPVVAQCAELERIVTELVAERDALRAQLSADPELGDEDSVAVTLQGWSDDIVAEIAYNEGGEPYLCAIRPATRKGWISADDLNAAAVEAEALETLRQRERKGP
ncbi:MAG: hypothetical protein ACRC1H_19560 [Caldilineaceae bacterium]